MTAIQDKCTAIQSLNATIATQQTTNPTGNILGGLLGGLQAGNLVSKAIGG